MAERLDNDWFHDHRRVLFSSWVPPSARAARTVHAARLGIAVRRRDSSGRLDDTERMLARLPHSQEAAARAHMQLYRACLEATSLVPSDELVSAAVQIEWLWYTTPFKKFYRDHLAHVMKVATVALELWLRPEILCPDGPLIDRVAKGLASRELGCEVLRGVARRLGNDDVELAKTEFWRTAVLEASRLACLLHDLAYPSIMAGKYVTPAAAITDPIAAPRDERHIAAQRARLGVGEHLLTAPFANATFFGRRLDGNAADTFTYLVETSHSLQAGLRILQFGMEADRIWRLTPLEAFVIEWAAAAAALHDYDKAFELYLKKRLSPSTDSSPIQEWFGDDAHAFAIRPSFRRDPVSYMVSLADQLQDFGRLNHEMPRREATTTAVHLRVPVEAVTLRRKERTLDIAFELSKSATASERASIQRAKMGNQEAQDVLQRLGADAKIFGVSTGESSGVVSWLDHGDLFESVTVRVIDAQ